MNTHMHPIMPGVETQSFKLAMRSLAGGVSVITAGTGDERTGATVTSAMSLCLDPPTMAVSINLSSSTWRAIRHFGHFCVNVLGRHHHAIADRFAGKDGLKGPARYAGAEWELLATGAMALTDALAAIDCEVEEAIERHSHAIILGRVAAVRATGGDPLIYAGGRYGSFAG